MANLVKMTNLSINISYDSVESFHFRKLLKDNNIPHTINFLREEHIQGLLEHLSSMVYGEMYTEYTFNKLPIAIWTEHYDDYERWLEVATNLEQLKNSNVIKYKELIHGI